MPLRVLQVVVEPSQEDLLRGQAQELLECLVILQQPVQLGVQLDIDLAEKTSPDDLPDQTQDQMLAHLDDVSTANVDDGTPNAFRRLNNNVVVLGEVEVVQRLDLLAGLVQDTLVDCVRHAVVDQFRQHETVLALVEHLEGIGGERQAVANIWVAGEDGIDVARELGSLVFVDGVRDVRRGALDLNPATSTADAGLRGVLGSRGRAAGSAGYCARARWAGAHALLCRRRLAQLGDEVYIVVQLYSPRAVELDLLQRLAHYIVRLVLRLLGGLDDGRLVEVALVVDVELAEGVLQTKDLALLELGVLSARNGCQAPWNLGDLRGSLPLELDDIHSGGGLWGIAEGGRRV